LTGQGKLNIAGHDQNIVAVKQRIQRDGDPVTVIYAKIGVLFDNEKKAEQAEGAPDKSGPIDNMEKRMAAWIKEKDGRFYMSIAVSDKEGRGDDSQRSNSVADPAVGSMGDEIPF
jgi:hypothetical protein